MAWGQHRTKIGEDVARSKYLQSRYSCWHELATKCAYEVMGGLCEDIFTRMCAKDIREMRFLPGGRYLYYTGRPIKAYNNCYCLSALSDTREDWADLSRKVVSCLMMGGGIGVDYSIYRAYGAKLFRTGGYASGPVDAMRMMDYVATYIQQGGSRRSAVMAMLIWSHLDAGKLITAKDWDNIEILGTGITYGEAKRANYLVKAPLDSTNISLRYDDNWLCDPYAGGTFLRHVEMALKNGEPGFLFNFGEQSGDVLRNACGEITTSDDSDACNLGSVNMAEIENLDEFEKVIRCAVRFLMSGRTKVDTPYQKVRDVCNDNNRIGLGLLGIHEWLLMRGYKYEVVPELHKWLKVYKEVSDAEAKRAASEFGLNEPVGVRAIAPTGTTSIVAGTTSGIEPLFSIAYLRRYLRNDRWVEEKVVDATARYLIETRGVDPNDIQTAYNISFSDRVKFQADVQDYVDQGISGTINISNDVDPKEAAETIIQYAPRLRGITVYPDGARGGQPLTPISYADAVTEIAHNTCTIHGKNEC